MVEPAGCDRVVRVALGWTGQEAYPTALTMPTRSQPVRLQERPHYLRELVRPVYLRKVTGPLDDTELRVREGLGIEAARRFRVQALTSVYARGICGASDPPCAGGTSGALRLRPARTSPGWYIGCVIIHHIRPFNAATARQIPHGAPRHLARRSRDHAPGAPSLRCRAGDRKS